MRKTNMLGLMAAIAFLASPAIVAPAFAVDNTISALCRADHAGSTYQRPGGFCDQVATNKPLGSHSGGPSMCPAGTEPNPTPPPACIPVI